MGLDGVFPDFAALRTQGFAGITCAKAAIMIAMTPRTEIFNPRGPAPYERDRRRAADFASYRVQKHIYNPS